MISIARAIRAVTIFLITIMIVFILDHAFDLWIILYVIPFLCAYVAFKEEL